MRLDVGVKVILRNSDGLYLLLQRSEPLADGSGIKWDIPGGRIEPGEGLMDALSREVEEEVGFRLSETPKLIMAQDIFVPDKGFHVVRLAYVLELAGKVVLGAEHNNYQWVTLEQALNLQIDRYLRAELLCLQQ